jgi:hypothetical protein
VEVAFAPFAIAAGWGHTCAEAVVAAAQPAAASTVPAAGTALGGTAAIIVSHADVDAGERSIGGAHGAVTTALTRPSIVLDTGAKPIDTGGGVATSLVETTAAPHVGAAGERAR